MCPSDGISTISVGSIAKNNFSSGTHPKSIAKEGHRYLRIVDVLHLIHYFVIVKNLISLNMVQMLILLIKVQLLLDYLVFPAFLNLVM